MLQTRCRQTTTNGNMASKILPAPVGRAGGCLPAFPPSPDFSVFSPPFLPFLPCHSLSTAFTQCFVGSTEQSTARVHNAILSFLLSFIFARGFARISSSLSPSLPGHLMCCHNLTQPASHHASHRQTEMRSEERRGEANYVAKARCQHGT